MKLATMTKLTVSFIISLTVASMVYATEFRSINELGMDASAIAIGQISSYGNTPLSTLQSPINSPRDTNTVSTFYNYTMNSELTHYALAASYIIDSNFRIGSGIVIENNPGIDQTASQNNQFVGVSQLQYTQQELVTNLIYTLTPEWEIGSNIHLINRNNFGITGSLIGLSLGAKYDTSLWGISFVGNYLNSPTMTFSNGAKETLSAQWTTALRYSIPDLPVDTFAQVSWVQATSQFLKHAGTRVWIAEGFSLSAGYMEVRNVTSQIQGKLTLGTGITIYPLSIDYAFTASDYIEQTAQHKFTVSYLF